MPHPNITRRSLLGSLVACPFSNLPANAAPRPYRLDATAAQIEFLFDLGGITQRGMAPLARAALQIDPKDLSASTVDVTADISRARTGLIFATEAMKSESVLNTAQYPLARFRSTRVVLGRGGRISDGAALEGQLTLRGVARAVRFDASLFRPPGSLPEDLSQLDVRLRGTISRASFGVVGYPQLVADSVGLDIRAKIRATR